MMKSSNPALRTGAFASLRENVDEIAAERAKSTTMTIEGTALKIGILLILVGAGAAWTWTIFANAGEAGSQAVLPWMIGGIVGGAIVSVVTIFKQPWARFTAPLYAVLEGIALGGISAFYEANYPGLPMLAVALTIGVTAIMAALYVTRVIKATGRLIGGIVAATGAIALAYLATFILSFFGVNLGLVHGGGIVSIGFSVVVVVVAALNLILDFSAIEGGVERNAPKWAEWYGAFSILMTLVWLYIEMLHLLAKLRGRK